MNLRSWRTQNRRVVTRSLCVGMSLVFLFPFLSWAFDSTAYTPPRSTLAIQDRPLAIPSALAEVVDTHDAGPGRPVVVYVQDLHCNYEVQRNISQLIDQLHRIHGLRLVAVEGASAGINLCKLADFPLAWARREIGDHLLREGRITGAEFFGASTPRAIRLEGIEDPELYEADRVAVMKLLNEESQGFVYDLRDALESLKPGLYNPMLRQVDSQKTAFRNGEMSLLKYSLLLAQHLRRGGLDLANFPTLRAYVAARRDAFGERVDSDRLYDELEAADREVRQALYSRPEQAELDRLEHRLDLIEKMMNISLRPEELAEIRSEPQAFRPAQFLDFLQRHQEHFEPETEWMGLDLYLEHAAEFYRIADERSHRFAANVLAKLDTGRLDMALLITGGYHSREVLAALKARGVSYVSLRPRLTRQDVANPYFSFLRNKRTPLEKLLAKNQNIFALPSAFPQSDRPEEPLADVSGQPETVQLLDATLDVLEHLALTVDQADRRWDDPRLSVKRFEAAGAISLQVKPGVFAVLRRPGSPWSTQEENAALVTPLRLKDWHVALMDAEVYAGLEKDLEISAAPLQLARLPISPISAAVLGSSAALVGAAQMPATLPSLGFARNLWSSMRAFPRRLGYATSALGQRLSRPVAGIRAAWNRWRTSSALPEAELGGAAIHGFYGSRTENALRGLLQVFFQSEFAWNQGLSSAVWLTKNTISLFFHSLNAEQTQAFFAFFGRPYRNVHTGPQSLQLVEAALAQWQARLPGTPEEMKLQPARAQLQALRQGGQAAITVNNQTVELDSIRIVELGESAAADPSVADAMKDKLREVGAYFQIQGRTGIIYVMPDVDLLQAVAHEFAENVGEIPHAEVMRVQNTALIAAALEIARETYGYAGLSTEKGTTLESDLQMIMGQMAPRWPALTIMIRNHPERLALLGIAYHSSRHPSFQITPEKRLTDLVEEFNHSEALAAAILEDRPLTALLADNDSPLGVLLHALAHGQKSFYLGQNHIAFPERLLPAYYSEKQRAAIRKLMDQRGGAFALAFMGPRFEPRAGFRTTPEQARQQYQEVIAFALEIGAHVLTVPHLGSGDFDQVTKEILQDLKAANLRPGGVQQAEELLQQKEKMSRAKRWDNPRDAVAKHLGKLMEEYPELRFLEDRLAGVFTGKSQQQIGNLAKALGKLHERLRALEGYRAEVLADVMAGHAKLFMNYQDILLGYQRYCGFENFAAVENMLDHLRQMAKIVTIQHDARLMNKIQHRRVLKSISQLGIEAVTQLVQDKGVEAIDILERASRASKPEEVYLASENLQIFRYLQGLVDQTTHPILICENLSYGRFVVEPWRDKILEYAAAQGKAVRIIRTRASSGASHTNPHFIRGDLLPDADLDAILSQAPHVVVVDGSKNQRYPDGFQQFANFAAIVNLALNQDLTLEEVRRLVKKSDAGKVEQLQKHQSRLLEEIEARQRALAAQPFRYDVRYWSADGRLLPTRWNKHMDAYQPSYQRLQEFPDQRQMILINGTITDDNIPEEVVRELSLRYPWKEHHIGFFEDFYAFVTPEFMQGIKEEFARLHNLPPAVEGSIATDAKLGPEGLLPVDPALNLNGIQIFNILYDAYAAVLAGTPGAPVRADSRDGRQEFDASTRIRKLGMDVGRQAYREALQKTYKGFIADWDGTLHLEDIAELLKQGVWTGLATGRVIKLQQAENIAADLRRMGCKQEQLDLFTVYGENGATKFHFVDGVLREDPAYRREISQEQIGILERMLAGLPGELAGIQGAKAEGTAYYAIALKDRNRCFELARALLVASKTQKNDFNILIEGRELHILPAEITKRRAAEDMARVARVSLEELFKAGDSVGSLFDNDLSLVAEDGFAVASSRPGTIWGISPARFGLSPARGPEALRQLLRQVKLLPAREVEPAFLSLPERKHLLDGTAEEILQALEKKGWKLPHGFRHELDLALDKLGPLWRSSRTDRLLRALIITILARRFTAFDEKRVEDLEVTEAEQRLLVRASSPGMVASLTGVSTLEQPTVANGRKIWNRIVGAPLALKAAYPRTRLQFLEREVRVVQNGNGGYRLQTAHVHDLESPGLQNDLVAFLEKQEAGLREQALRGEVVDPALLTFIRREIQVRGAMASALRAEVLAKSEAGTAHIALRDLMVFGAGLAIGLVGVSLLAWAAPEVFAELQPYLLAGTAASLLNFLMMAFGRWQAGRDLNVPEELLSWNPFVVFHGLTHTWLDRIPATRKWSAAQREAAVYLVGFASFAAAGVALAAAFAASPAWLFAVTGLLITGLAMLPWMGQRIRRGPPWSGLSALAANARRLALRLPFQVRLLDTGAGARFPVLNLVSPIYLSEGTSAEASFGARTVGYLTSDETHPGRLGHVYQYVFHSLLPGLRMTLEKNPITDGSPVVIDFGVGRGAPTTRELEEHLAHLHPNARLIGVDNNEAIIAELADQQSHRLRFEVGGFELAEKHQNADLMFMMNVLRWYGEADRPRYLVMAGRALRPGGLLVEGNVASEKDTGGVSVYQKQADGSLQLIQIMLTYNYPQPLELPLTLDRRMANRIRNQVGSARMDAIAENSPGYSRYALIEGVLRNLRATGYQPVRGETQSVFLDVRGENIRLTETPAPVARPLPPGSVIDRQLRESGFAARHPLLYGLYTVFGAGLLELAYALPGFNVMLHLGLVAMGLAAPQPGSFRLLASGVTASLGLVSVALVLAPLLGSWSLIPSLGFLYAWAQQAGRYFGSAHEAVSLQEEGRLRWLGMILTLALFSPAVIYAGLAGAAFAWPVFGMTAALGAALNYGLHVASNLLAFWPRLHWRLPFQVRLLDTGAGARLPSLEIFSPVVLSEITTEDSFRPSSSRRRGGQGSEKTPVWDAAAIRSWAEKYAKTSRPAWKTLATASEDVRLAVFLAAAAVSPKQAAADYEKFEIPRLEALDRLAGFQQQHPDLIQNAFRHIYASVLRPESMLGSYHRFSESMTHFEQRYHYLQEVAAARHLPARELLEKLNSSWLMFMPTGVKMLLKPVKIADLEQRREVLLATLAATLISQMGRDITQVYEALAWEMNQSPTPEPALEETWSHVRLLHQAFTNDSLLPRPPDLRTPASSGLVNAGKVTANKRELLIQLDGREFLFSYIPLRQSEREGYGLNYWGVGGKHDDLLGEPDAFIYHEQDPAQSRKSGLKGMMIQSMLRGHGLMRPMLNVFFNRFPEVRRTHHDIRNFILLSALIHTYGFGPEQPIQPNVWIKTDPSGKAQVCFENSEEAREWLEGGTPITIREQYQVVSSKDETFLPLYYQTPLVVRDEAKFRQALAEYPVTLDGLIPADAPFSIGYWLSLLLDPWNLARSLTWGKSGLFLEIPALTAAVLVLANQGNFWGVAAALLAFGAAHLLMRWQVARQRGQILPAGALLKTLATFLPVLAAYALVPLALPYGFLAFLGTVLVASLGHAFYDHMLFQGFLDAEIQQAHGLLSEQSFSQVGPSSDNFKGIRLGNFLKEFRDFIRSLGREHNLRLLLAKAPDEFDAPLTRFSQAHRSGNVVAMLAAISDLNRLLLPSGYYISARASVELTTAALRVTLYRILEVRSMVHGDRRFPAVLAEPLDDREAKNDWFLPVRPHRAAVVRMHLIRDDVRTLIVPALAGVLSLIPGDAVATEARDLVATDLASILAPDELAVVSTAAELLEKRYQTVERMNRKLRPYPTGILDLELPIFLRRADLDRIRSMKSLNEIVAPEVEEIEDIQRRLAADRERLEPALEKIARQVAEAVALREGLAATESPEYALAAQLGEGPLFRINLLLALPFILEAGREGRDHPGRIFLDALTAELFTAGLVSTQTLVRTLAQASPEKVEQARKNAFVRVAQKETPPGLASVIDRRLHDTGFDQRHPRWYFLFSGLGAGLLELAYAVPLLNVMLHRGLAALGLAAPLPAERGMLEMAVIAPVGLLLIGLELAPFLGAWSLAFSLAFLYLWADQAAQYFAQAHADRSPAAQARLRRLGILLTFALASPPLIYLALQGSAWAWADLGQMLVLGFGLNYALHGLNNLLALLGRQASFRTAWPRLARGLRNLELASVIRGKAQAGARYIYDAVMKNSLIQDMRKTLGLVASDEMLQLQSEVGEIYEKVLAAAKKSLVDQGKARLAEGLEDAELFLADMESIGASALINFNFVTMHLGLLKQLQREGRLTKDLIAFILAHEVMHLIQYREDLESGKRDTRVSLNLRDLLRKKFMDKPESYAREQEADLRALAIVSAAGYNVRQAVSFFQMVAQDERNLLGEMWDEHPVPAERVHRLEQLILSSNWPEVRRVQEFSQEALAELAGPRTRLRQRQQAVAAIATVADLEKAIAEAETLDELMVLNTRVLHRVLAEEVAKVMTAGPVLGQALQESLKAKLAWNGRLEILDSRLWYGESARAANGDIQPLVAILALGYVVDDRLLSNQGRLFAPIRNAQNIPVDLDLDDIAREFAAHPQLGQLIQIRERLRSEIQRAAREIVPGPARTYTRLVLELMKIQGETLAPGGGYEHARMFRDVNSGLRLHEIIPAIRDLPAPFTWEFDPKDWELTSFQDNLGMAANAFYRSYLKTVAEQALRQAHFLPLEQLVRLWDELIQKEKEGLIIAGDIYSDLMKVICERYREENQPAAVRDVIYERMLDPQRSHLPVVHQFFYDELLADPDNADALKGLQHWQIQRWVYQIFKNHLDNWPATRDQVLLMRDLERGDFGRLVAWFNLDPAEVRAITRRLHPDTLALEQMQKIILRLDQQKARVGQASDPFEPDALAVDLWRLLEQPLSSEDEGFVRKQTSVALAAAGLDPAVDSLDPRLLRWLFFFDAGGTLDLETFRAQARELTAVIPADQLGLAARFLNSRYMHQKQIQRGVPEQYTVTKDWQTFLQNAPVTALEKETFYKPKVWPEYIAFFNALAFWTIQGQAQVVADLAAEKENGVLRMFRGELAGGVADGEGIQARPELQTWIQTVYRTVLDSTQKYLDRTDWTDATLVTPALTSESGNRFADQVAEIAALLPAGIYRNYLLLGTLVRELPELAEGVADQPSAWLREIQRVLASREKANQDNAPVYAMIETIAPLLAFDHRIEGMNALLLQTMSLRVAGKSVAAAMALPQAAEPEASGLWAELRRVWHLIRDYLQARSILRRLRNIPAGDRQGLEDLRQQVLKVASADLFPAYAPDLAVVIQALNNHFREKFLMQLHAPGWIMPRLLRLVLWNQERRAPAKIDLFHFDYQQRQTQLDSSVPALADKALRARISATASFQTKLDHILGQFRRPSALRDRYLELLAEDELQRQADPAVRLASLELLQREFHNPYFKEKYGLAALQLERSLQPARYVWNEAAFAGQPWEKLKAPHRVFVEANVRLALKYFSPGYTRDDVLLAMLQQARTDEEYELIRTHLYQFGTNIRTEGEATKQIFFEDKLKLLFQELNPAERKDALLWILGIRPKPVRMREWELYLGVSFDRLREVFSGRSGLAAAAAGDGLDLERVGNSSRREFIRQMFSGPGGLLEDDALYSAFMHDVFERVVPKNQPARETLRLILDTVVKHSDQRRRLEMIQAMAANMARMFEGQAQDGSEVIGKFFESMGLVGVKMAQTLAHAYDIPLPEELRQVLANLSTHADPLSKMVVFETIRNNYPEGFDAVFDYIGDELGTASIKLVYQAKRKGIPEERVFKVKRPAVDQQIEIDLEFLRAVMTDLRQAGLPIPEGLEHRLSGAIAEDADFNRELAITEAFAGQSAKINREDRLALSSGTSVEFGVATIYPDTLRNNVTMETELIRGVALSDEKRLVAEGLLTPQELAELKPLVFRFLMIQMFRYGHYLADPHGGNFYVTRHAGKLQVVLIDNGSDERVVTTEANFRHLLEAMVWLTVNPGGAIPRDYLYTSVFFTKTGFLRQTLDARGMLDMIFQITRFTAPGRAGPLTVEEYMADLRESFAKRMTWRQKIAYLWRNRAGFRRTPHVDNTRPTAPAPTGADLSAEGQAMMPDWAPFLAMAGVALNAAERQGQRWSWTLSDAGREAVARVLGIPLESTTRLHLILDAGQPMAVAVEAEADPVVHVGVMTEILEEPSAAYQRLGASQMTGMKGLADRQVAPFALAAWGSVETLGQRLPIYASVFPPFGPSSHALISSVEVQPGQRVCEMGCGLGVVAAMAAKAGASEVVAMDFNPMAVVNARETARRLGFSDRIRTVQGDLFTTADGEDVGLFDQIYFNPPMLDKIAASMEQQAWMDPGFQVITRFFEQAAQHLKPGGTITVPYMLQNNPRFYHLVYQHGLHFKRVAHRTESITGSLEAAVFVLEKRQTDQSALEAMRLDLTAPSKDFLLPWAAAQALGFEGERGLAMIVRALDMPNTPVRAKLYRTLGRMYTSFPTTDIGIRRGLLNLIAGGMQDYHPMVRSAAGEAFSMAMAADEQAKKDTAKPGNGAASFAYWLLRAGQAQGWSWAARLSERWIGRLGLAGGVLEATSLAAVLLSPVTAFSSVGTGLWLALIAAHLPLMLLAGLRGRELAASFGRAAAILLGYGLPVILNIPVLTLAAGAVHVVNDWLALSRRAPATRGFSVYVRGIYRLAQAVTLAGLLYLGSAYLYLHNYLGVIPDLRHHYQVEDSLPPQADYILGLGTGLRHSGAINRSSAATVAKMAALYHRGLAPEMVVVGGNPVAGVSEGQAMARTMAQVYALPVTEAEVPLDHYVTTSDVLASIDQVFQQRPPARVIVVGQPRHLPRVLWNLRTAFPKIQFHPVNAKESYDPQTQQTRLHNKFYFTLWNTAAWLYYWHFPEQPKHVVASPAAGSSVLTAGLAKLAAGLGFVLALLVAVARRLRGQPALLGDGGTQDSTQTSGALMRDVVAGSDAGQARESRKVILLAVYPWMQRLPGWAAGWLAGAAELFHPLRGRYRVEQSSRDGMTSYRFTDLRSAASFEIVPGLANKIVSFVVDGEEVLHFEKVAASGGIEVMYPYIDRVRGNGFSWQGRRVDLDDPGLVEKGLTKKDQQGTVYHGMVRKLPWRLEDIRFGRNGIEIRSAFVNADYPEILKRFGPGRITLTYRLSNNALTSRIDMDNRSLATTGSHPWIKRGEGEWYLRVPAQEEVVMQDMIPTGARRPVAGTALDLRQFARSDQNRHAVLGGLQPDAQGKVTSQMYNAKNGMLVEVEQDAAMPFIVVWDKEAKFFAMEPVSSPPDGLNDADGERGLNPIQSRRYVSEVTYRVRRMLDDQRQPQRPETVTEAQDQKRIVGAPLNQPLLFRASPWFQRLPWLHRGWMLIQAIQVRMIGRHWTLPAGFAPAPDARLRLLAAGAFAELPAEFRELMKHPGLLRLHRLSLAEHGFWQWLRGQILGAATMNPEGEADLYLPDSVFQVLSGQPTAGHARAWQDQQAAEAWFQHMVHAHSLRLTADALRQVSFRVPAVDRELSTAKDRPEPGYTAPARELPLPNTYWAGREGHLNIASSQIIALLLHRLPGLRADSRSRLQALTREWLNRKPTVQTLLNALETLPADDPVLGVLRSLLRDSRQLAGHAQTMVMDGVLSNLATVLAPESPEASQGVPRVAKVTSVAVTGLPAAEAGALIGLVRQAIAQMPSGAPRAPLEAILAALQAAQGQAADRLIPLAQDGQGEMLAGLLAQLPDFETSVLGSDFDRTVYAVNAGVRELALAPGQVVAVREVIETVSDLSEPSAVESQIRSQAWLAGTTARAFQRRAQPAEVRDQAPGLAPAIRRFSAWFGGRLTPVKIALEILVLTLMPIAAWQAAAHQLPAELRDTRLAGQLRALDVNSQDPLASAYREMVFNRTPQARAELAKVLLRMIRSGQTAGQAAGERALEWMAFSEFLKQLGGMPMLDIAALDSLHPLYPSLPAALKAVKVAVPVALLEAKRAKGALGFMTRGLEQSLFTVRDEIIRLFLQRGLTRFESAA